MALLHDHSEECTKSELDLFTLPPTQTSIEKGQYVEYHPISNIADGGPIQFYVPGSSEEYIDPSQTQLYVKVKVTKGDGTDLKDTDVVGPCNLLLQTLFSQVDVTLNERLISASTPTYPYRAMIETLLTYDKGAKASQLTASGWSKDTAGKMDNVNCTASEAETNAGLKTRRKRILNSRILDLIGPIHGDLFCQDKHLINGVDLKVKLVPSSDAFCLMASGENPTYKIKIMDASLFIRRVTVSSAVMLGHIKALEKGTAKYPLRRVVCKMMSVPRGNLTLTQDHLFLGQLPNRIVVGCVSNAAFNGSYSKNPYNFQHFNVNYVSVHVNGEQIPHTPLKPDYAAGRKSCVRSYHTLFSGMDKMYMNEGNNISLSEYPDGYTLYAFDLTPDLACGGHFSLVKHGNLRLDMHIASPLEETINIIIYAEFNNILEIDQARNIIFDYNS